MRQPQDVSSGVLEQIAKLRGELLVAVHEEESLAAQKAVEWVGEIPTDLVVSKNTNELKNQRDQLPQSERKVRSRERLGSRLLRF